MRGEEFRERRPRLLVGVLPVAAAAENGEAVRRARIDLDLVRQMRGFELARQRGDILQGDGCVGAAVQDEKGWRSGGIGFALRRLETAMEGDIALDARGLARARELERCRAAEAIADHHGRLVSPVARFPETRKQEL